MTMRAQPPSGERGFIIVAVLWILAALSGLVLIYMNYVTNTAMVVAANADRPQAEALVAAGIELATYELTSGPPEMRPGSGKFDAKIGPHRIAVSFVSEAARIDLNTAQKPLLIGFFVSLGARPDAAESYADRIVGWRTPTKDDNNPESALYRMSGTPYPPRLGPFPQAEELYLVRGIPQPFIDRAMPFVTTFSNQATVSIADAAPQVVAALPAMTPDRLQNILTARGNPQIDRRGLASMAGEGAAMEPAKAYRINVAVQFDNGRRSGTEAVIMLLEEGTEPYRVLSWQNRFDGGPTLQQSAAR